MKRRQLIRYINRTNVGPSFYSYVDVSYFPVVGAAETAVIIHCYQERRAPRRAGFESPLPSSASSFLSFTVSG